MAKGRESPKKRLSSSKMSDLSFLTPILAPVTLAATGYVAYKVQWDVVLKAFFTGPGRLQRVFFLLFAIFNWKNMPFAWTVRVWYSVYYHHFIRRAPILGPRALFAPVISSSYAPVLETDYNLHKSNSTYFADLDVSRTHLTSYICGKGFREVSKNATTKLVIDPTTQKPAKGGLGIMLGGVHCSFHREIPPYRTYEMWSRVLAWDRKWLYIVTHYVPKGLGRPSEWLDPKFGRLNKKAGGDVAKDWEKKIFATAVSKYVFKLNRLTIHPGVILDASGMLPERPGGWAVVDDVPLDLPNGDATAAEGDGLDWKSIERRRREGMVFAEKFHAMDGLQKAFDGGQGAVVGRFGPG